MNTNKNSYTLIYMVVMIIIVSLLLSITSGALKSRQAANVELDKKKQILSSIPAISLENADAAQLYNDYIQDYVMLDSRGEIIKSVKEDFNYKPEEGEYPMYIANVNGETKYILPMHGAGLWGAIWGYLALDADKNSVNGVFYSHASETPGLGAEIVTPKFRDQYIGKKVMRNGEFASIAVEKPGIVVQNQDQVDAISGGTITSKGVESMMKNSIEPYAPFLLKQEVAEEPVETNEKEETTNEME